MLSLREIQIAGEALNSINNDREHHFAVTCAAKCDPNILGYVNDLIIQVDTINVSVVCCFVSGGIRISVRSCINDINAVELTRFITEGIGSGGGHRQKAGGFISLDKMPDADPDSIVDFLIKRVTMYYENFDIIRAEEYTVDPDRMKIFVKKPQIMGFVTSDSIFGYGASFRVRSVEADFKVRASDDLIIMTDSRGSAYLIDKAKFDSTYEVTEGVFDVRADYHPHAICFDREPREPHKLCFSCCRSRGGAKVYARRLDRNTKLYTIWDSKNYISGMVGDYLVVRMDDQRDVYIIDRERFDEIYKEL